ncbi:O-antigen ligase family protein [Bizionia myxarmorum]|uniref:O-antigen ligase family protein n=1 Tax=Bizionia myxarmorum TaxID=291186 RepID=A0A5D0RC01_9FLAO|nr:hypothetical protein [Bizionia myxarmorum]TYB79042.1 hypothetical protein ES674_04495 [Bizionia myxarmorum]
MLKDKYICNFLLILVLLYYGQGIVYPMGSVLSQASLLILMLASIVYFIKELFLEKLKISLFVKAWTALLLLNVIGFFLKGKFESFGALQSILLNMLPFYTFHYFSRKDVLTKNNLITLLVLLLPIFIYKFIQSNIELQALKNREDVVDNTIYMFLGLIPFAFLFKRKLFSLITLLVLWIIIVQSSKRAAIICGAYGVLLFYYYQLKTVNKKHQLLNYIFTISVIFGLSYLGYNYLMTNDYILLRLEYMYEGSSSGRDRLNEIVFAAWYESNNYITLLFGNGFATSGDVTINVSHNDWLDLLASFGLLGFGLYATLFYSSLKEIISGNWILNKKVAFMCLMGIGLVTSLTSRWYGSSFGYSQMLLLPYLLATKNKN